MSDALLFGIGGILLLLAVAAIAVYGVFYSKSTRRDQIGSSFPASDEDTKPGTPV